MTINSRMGEQMDIHTKEFYIANGMNKLNALNVDEFHKQKVR